MSSRVLLDVEAQTPTPTSIAPSDTTTNPLENMVFGAGKNPTKVILDENGKPFSLKHSKLNNSFCSNLFAILGKRINFYKRNKRIAFSEVVFPAIIMVVGVLIASIRYTE